MSSFGIYEWGGLILGGIAVVALLLAIIGGKRKRGDF